MWTSIPDCLGGPMQSQRSIEAGGRKMNMKRRRWDDRSRGQREERLGDSMLLALNTEKGAVAKEIG